MKKPTRPHAALSYFTLALLSTLCVFVPSLEGEDRNGDGVDDDADADAANAAALPEVHALLGRPTCTSCEPNATRVELVFDRAVDPSAVAFLTEVEPFVTLLPEQATASRRVVLRADFAPMTEYTFRLGEGKNLVGSRTAASLSFTFRTGGARPELVTPYGERVVAADARFPILMRQLESARVRAVRLAATELDAAIRVVGVHYDETDPVASLPPALAHRVATRSVTSAELNADQIAEVDVFALAGGAPALVVVDAPGVPTRAALLQRADVALTMKVGASGGLVWAVDPASGRAVRNADVRVFEGPHARFSGRTDASGILRLPEESRLRRVGGEPWDRPTLRALAGTGRTFAYTSEHFTTGIEGWELGVPFAYDNDPEDVRGMITAERGIYRPGETVHLLGVLRKRAPDGRLVPPRGRAIVDIVDPNGTAFAHETVSITPYGTFRLDVDIPGGSHLGGYVVSARLAGATGPEWRGLLTHRFEVGEFRANTFEVSLPTAGAAEWDHDTLVVPVAARYLYGSPVHGGTVRYSVSTRPHLVHIAEYMAFHFANERSGSGGDRYLTGGELTLDAHGQARIEIPRAALDAASGEGGAQSYDVLVEATVTDAADDTVTGRTAQTVAAEETMVGIKNDRWVLRQGDRWTVELLAVDQHERPVAGREIDVTLHRRVWRTVAEATAQGVRYSGHWDEAVVGTTTVRSAAGPVRASFELAGGGQYWIEASAGMLAPKATASVWASGEGAYGEVSNDPRVELVLDQRTYAPGDTAHVYTMSPFRESLALVTVERDGILSARTLRLHGTETAIDVPITHHHLPNAFVGVMLVPVGLGATSPSTGETLAPASGSPLRVGYAELRVSPEARRLEVEIEPTSRELEPGGEAEVIVRVRDHAHRPVRAEVTLWAADEGVLALTGYRTPDPFEPAYASAPLAVATAMSLTHFTTLDPESWYDEGGDSGAGAVSALRSRFLSTAFFSRGVVTDARGRARVRITLPDNLTRWRVMGAAADRGERFGAGQASITVRKDLQVTPALPRFLTEGDLVDAAVVVHNDTGRAGTARVSLDVAGAEVVGAREQTLEIADGEQKSVRFSVVSRDPGRATIRARASLGGETDGFELALPVHPATAWSTTLVGDGRIDGTSTVDLEMPAGAKPGTGELTITVAPSVLASLEAGMKSLLEYPNGCLEQTTSRLIPMVLLEDLVTGSAGSPIVDEAAHRARMDAAIAHVLTHQNADGGFGLWPSSSSEGFLTAYGLWGLVTARDHGYRVPPARIEAAIRYLGAHVDDASTDMHGQFDDAETRPFAAYVLSLANSANPTLGATLAAREPELSRFSVGLLANALGTAPESAPLFDALARAEVPHRAGKMVDERTPESGFMSYGRDLRATSSAVQALVAEGRAADAEELVAGILADRDPTGTWGTTYNNLWALFALSRYAGAVEAERGPVTVVVRLGADEIASVRVGGDRRVERIVVPTDRLPAPGSHARLTIEARGAGRARYSASLRYASTLAAQHPEDHGLRVTRELVDVDTGTIVTEPRIGQLLTVRMTVTNDTALSQVAVTDRLPAGFEPVDMSLETSERRARGGGREWSWAHRELHDERVAYFANHLYAGTHVAEYLVRATRSGEFARPAATAEAMYDPRVWGRGEIEHVIVRR